ncbi:MAG TPA: hypothetical protein VIR29_14380 [Anseongella sp.]
MALLILGVTTGFSMGQHFCQGELLEVTLFGKAKPCEMEMSRSELPPCHSAEHGDESADTFSEKPYCEDHHAAVEAQDTPTILKKGDDLLPPVKFLAAFTYAFFQSQLTSGDKGLHCSVYRPPLVPRDIPVLIQSFLI